MRPIPGLTIEEQPEDILKRMVLWGEARGEPSFTKLCILWVVKNRMTRRQTSWKQEILRPFQFSCFNHDDPNLPKLLIAWKLGSESWAECGVVVDLFPLTHDPTGGAQNYYDFKTSAPTWGRGNREWKELMTAGDLAFGVADSPPTAAFALADTPTASASA